MNCKQNVQFHDTNLRSSIDSIKNRNLKYLHATMKWKSKTVAVNLTLITNQPWPINESLSAGKERLPDCLRNFISIALQCNRVGRRRPLTSIHPPSSTYLGWNPKVDSFNIVTKNSQ